MTKSWHLIALLRHRREFSLESTFRYRFQLFAVQSRRFVSPIVAVIQLMEENR